MAGRGHQAEEVLWNRDRRREEIQEAPRPDVLEENRGDPVHNPGEKIEEQHRPEQRRDEVEARGRDAVLPSDPAPSISQPRTHGNSIVCVDSTPWSRCLGL